jgi:signal transduction histidine kinase
MPSLPARAAAQTIGGTAIACAEDARRERAITIGTLGLIALGVPFVFRYWALDAAYLSFALVATMLACAGNLVWLRRTHRTVLAGNVALALYFVVLLLSLSATGGFYDPNFSWLYTVPVAAAYLVGLGTSLVWMGLTMLATVGFWSLPMLGVEVPNLVPLDQVEGQALFDRLTAIAALAVLSTSFVSSRRSAERAVEESHRSLAREAACVTLLQHAAIAANQANTFESALEGFARQAMYTNAWRVAHVWMPADDASGDLVSSGIWLSDEPARYRPLQELTQTMRLAPGENALHQAMRTGRPVWDSEGCIHTQNSPRGQCAWELGLRSVVALPIASGREVVAVLEFFGSDPAPLDERLIEVLADAGRQIGRVQERIRLHDRLRQSQKLESVGQLAAGIAHEINNPMAYVRSNLGALRREWGALVAAAEKQGFPEELAARVADCEELIDESLEGVDRAIAIVRDVREFSHASETRLEAFDLAELIEGALRVAEAQRPGGVSVELELAPLEPISCIPSQLGQVFLNLLVNAFQAMDGSGTLRVVTRRAGALVVVSVEDDGPGIDPSARGRLFDPFFTTKPVGQGTGLGLYISYEIVRAHGGEIQVESEVGRGARFDVLLPAAGPGPSDASAEA